MSSTRICTARSSAKRKRLANQEDAPPPRKVQKTVSTRDIARTGEPLTVPHIERKKRKRSTLFQDPVDNLGPDDLGDSGKKPPLRYYGWPFKYDQVFDYAKRHHLCFAIVEQTRQSFDGKMEMDFADLSEKFHSDPKLLREMQKHASIIVCNTLAQSSGLPLDIGYLLSKDFDGVLYVWDNYNIDEQFDLAELFGTWDDGVKIIGKAMDEMTGQSSKLQWWHSWLNRQRLRA